MSHSPSHRIATRFFKIYGTTRTLERYVSNIFETHRKAVTMLSDRIDAVVANETSTAEKRPKVGTKVGICGLRACRTFLMRVMRVRWGT